MREVTTEITVTLKVGSMGSKWIVIDSSTDRMYVLSTKILKWNLKHVFELETLETQRVMRSLDRCGQATILLTKVQAA